MSFLFFQIVSQQGNDKELLRVDLSLFNYPEEYKKPIDVVDCDVKVQFAKANIVFLFKHIDAILVKLFLKSTKNEMISFRVFLIH
jgi:hypothetical protein